MRFTEIHLPGPRRAHGQRQLVAGNRGEPLENGKERQSRRLRRAVLGALAVVCITPATLALAAAPASAYVRINEHCILRAYEPLPFEDGTFLYSGAVDCRGQGNFWTEVEVCAEVQNTVSGDWYKITGSCEISGPGYLEYNETGGDHEGICGVNYRTWDRGEVWHGGKGKREGSWGSATYKSSAVKNVC